MFSASESTPSYVSRKQEQDTAQLLTNLHRLARGLWTLCEFTNDHDLLTRLRMGYTKAVTAQRSKTCVLSACQHSYAIDEIFDIGFPRRRLS